MLLYTEGPIPTKYIEGEHILLTNCGVARTQKIIGACRPKHTRALPELFQIIGTNITRTGREDTWSPAYSICMHRRTYSVQCSDKIRFPQLRIKCGVAKSCPGTHTALQAPMQKMHAQATPTTEALFVCFAQKFSCLYLYSISFCEHLRFCHSIAILRCFVFSEPFLVSNLHSSPLAVAVIDSYTCTGGTWSLVVRVYQDIF